MLVLNVYREVAQEMGAQASNKAEFHNRFPHMLCAQRITEASQRVAKRYPRRIRAMDFLGRLLRGQHREPMVRVLATLA